MAGKTTSAGYRLPTVNSEYHSKCISRQVKDIQESFQRAAAADGDKTHPPASFKKCNRVTEEKRWKESVNTETELAKKW